MIELGSNPLSSKSFFEIVYLNDSVQIDSSVPARFQRCDKPELIKAQSRAEAVVILSFFLNEDRSTSFETIVDLVRQINENAFEQGVQTNLVPAYLTPVISNYSLSSVALPLITLNLALFFELTNASCKTINEDFNKFKLPYLKQICDNVKYLTLNSKKVNVKKSNACVERFIIKTAEFTQQIIVQKPLVRALFQSSNSVLEFERVNLTPIELQIMSAQSQFRFNTLKTEFNQVNGIWRGIDLQVAKMDAFNATEMNIIDALLQELQQSVELLVTCNKIKNLQVGQTIITMLAELDACKGKALDVAHLVSSQLTTQSSSRRVPQPPTGTRDTNPMQMFARQKYLQMIKNIFVKHGSVEIETPTFETKQVLLEKYGDDQKLIYALEDFGEEQLALRYDLTVPFSRYCVTHNVKAIKRFQIGRVFRRDKPNFEKGRFREFYQLDFDIGGDEGAVNDAEVLVVMQEILALFKKEFKIYVNHRGLLNEVILGVGISQEKFKGVCSVIDQLDKISEEEVIHKLVTQKGILEEQAHKLMELIKLGSDAEIFVEYCKELRARSEFQNAAPYLDELCAIINSIKQINPQAVKDIKVDLSLARGLEYYTGMVFEAKLTELQSSVSGGGRYDHLLESINPSAHMPVVGGSIGIDRLFALLQMEKDLQQERQLDVQICAAPGGSLQARLEIYGQLLQNDVRTGVSFKDGGSLKSLKRDLEEANSAKCKFAIIVGQEECAGEEVTVKNLDSGEQFKINKLNLVEYICVELGKTNPKFALRWVQSFMLKLADKGLSAEEIAEIQKTIKSMI
ncbi:Histidyl-tRNA_synthetase [Hexamita inflata]|uniref:histidine--tRNA ligase n=1 Tax=Hexamita inflata TaxID=28002 RepID=A0AA86VNB8_9EUKA|nr:Histidyl-tRNA synthetase [Hexamita inflata]